MVRVFTFIMLLFPLIWEVVPVKAQNPFISREDERQVAAAPSLTYPFLARIAFWQQQLNKKISVLAKKAKETGSIRPLLPLIIIAFVYGALHAAGPGHGKAVAASYLISHGRRLREGILVGNLIAFFHGLSGVGLVMIVYFVLGKGISGPLESVTRTTQIVSYSLIALLGAGLLARKVFLWRQSNNPNKRDHYRPSEKRQKYPMAMAMAVGMIPCPGVVLVMLFCLSLNVVGLGLLLALCLTLGMALTISAIGIVGLFVKNLALGLLERRPTLVEIIEHVLEITAALMVMALGLLFLIITI